MEFAGILVAGLLIAVAWFQIALVAGAPWGDHAFGGRAETHDGRLTDRYRVMSAIAVPLLVAAAWIVLARSEVVSTDGSWPEWAVWVVFAYLALNTLANLASKSRIERFAMGGITAIATIATLLVALS
jgi:hypothetical protein